MKIFATITEKDSPSAGFYRARTCFGQNVSGVSLKGPNFPLIEKQQVAVFEVGGQFGSFSALGEYPSLLSVPGEIKPGFCKQAPAKASLAYLAYLVKNTKKWYAVGTVTGISGDNLIVDGKVIPTKGVSAAYFSSGDQVLIDKRNRNAVVIGWWNTVPSGLPAGVPAICISRIPYSSSVDMVMYIGNEAIKSIKLSKYPDTEYVDAAWVETLRTSDADEYFYSHVRMFRLFGLAYEDHYVRWHKVNFTVEHIDILDYNALAAIQPAYTTTADNKIWWWSYPTPPAGTDSADWCYISDTPDGVKIPVFNSGVLLDPGAWFPAKGYHYGDATS